ncbi:MAG: Stk1 family PASTA domain-containing Ser/Thr kinase [Actinomycetaceae bacterium]|nr:Stk1 family PASTA domain-containing Ser/Thr kinase [Actinomycetaceae bacterium]
MATTLIAGRYEIRTLIGRGGMAEVHLGYDTRLSRMVAIKMLRIDLARDSIFQARFRREAQSAASLNHPNIVAVYDTGEEKIVAPDASTIMVPYIIMEYVEGHTVRDLLSDGSPVPIDEAIEIMDGVLHALEYAHAEGLVHRDIKPGNIMLTNTGKIKVMDFGIARALADSSATMTQTDAVVGTAQYLSPEQARGERVDHRSDLYSAGCLLYELLTGRPPFVGDSAVSVAYQHVSKVPEPPASITPDIPDALNRVVMKSLAKDRATRYMDAAHMLADLKAAGAGAAVSAPSVATWGSGKTQVLTQADNMAATQAFMPASPTTPTTPGLGEDFRKAREEAKALEAKKERKTKTRNRAIITIIVLLALATLGTVLYMMFSGKDPNLNISHVPTNIVGMSRAEARTALDKEGLVMVEGEPEESSDHPAGTVLRSNPTPGSEVERGSKVTVILSKGVSEIAIPDVAGMSQSQARATLEAAGLSVGSVSTEDSGKYAKDQVIRSNPEAGKSVTKGTSIDLIVGSGNVTVPADMVGKSKDEVLTYLRQNGLSVTITEVETNNRPAGTVLTIDPTGQVKSGSSITITVAKAAPSAPKPPKPDPGNGGNKPPNAPGDGDQLPGGGNEGN